MAWIRAAALAEVKERRVMDAEVGGEEIALYWVDDAVYATHNICTHAFARLSEGYLDGDCIECPIHQALFNVKTGEVVAPPAYDPVKTFPCRIEETTCWSTCEAQATATCRRAASTQMNDRRTDVRNW